MASGASKDWAFQQENLAKGILRGLPEVVGRNVEAGVTAEHIRLVVEICSRDFPDNQSGKEQYKRSRKIAEMVISNAGIDALREPVKDIPGDISVKITDRLEDLRLAEKTGRDKQWQALNNAILHEDERTIDFYTKKENAGVIDYEHLKSEIQQYDKVEPRLINPSVNKPKAYRILEKFMNAAGKEQLKKISHDMHKESWLPEEDNWVKPLSQGTRDAVHELVDKAIRDIDREGLRSDLKPQRYLTIKDTKYDTRGF